MSKLKYSYESLQNFCNENSIELCRDYFHSAHIPSLIEAPLTYLPLVGHFPVECRQMPGSDSLLQRYKVARQLI